MMDYTCSCFCGRVRFEIELKNFNLEVCHCSACRKLMGATGFAGLECVGKLNWLSEERAAVFQSSERGERGFCEHCGSSLYFQFLPTHTFFVPIAVVTDLPEEKVRFVEEIYYDSKPCYYSFANATCKKTAADFA